MERLLRLTTRALDSAGVEYAIVGGNAVAEWVSTVDEDMVRFSKDVDILVRRTESPTVTTALAKFALIPAEVLRPRCLLIRMTPNQIAVFIS